jgi:hypothetical protein
LILSRSKPDRLKNQDKGFDGGKNVYGRKRNLLVDTEGLPMTVRVTSAQPHDSIVFSLYCRTGLRTALGLAHLGSLGIAPPGLFSAQYDNKLKTLYLGSVGFKGNQEKISAITKGFW